MLFVSVAHQEDEIFWKWGREGGGVAHNKREEKWHFRFENVKERDTMEDLRINKRIIFKRIIQKQGVRVQKRFIWFRILITGDLM
jgi:hypothetical protein